MNRTTINSNHLAEHLCATLRGFSLVFLCGKTRSGYSQAVFKAISTSSQSLQIFHIVKNLSKQIYDATEIHLFLPCIIRRISDTDWPFSHIILKICH